jgi:hypothetical protein
VHQITNLSVLGDGRSSWKFDGRPAAFHRPYRADKVRGGYCVRDANGQAIANVYSRDNEDEARQAKMLTKDEARTDRHHIARLPELLGKVEPD